MTKKTSTENKAKEVENADHFSLAYSLTAPSPHLSPHHHHHHRHHYHHTIFSLPPQVWHYCAPTWNIVISVRAKRHKMFLGLFSKSQSNTEK